jgi:hypothetical protein
MIIYLWTEGMNSAKKLREYWTGLRRWPVGILDYILQMIWRIIWLNHASDLKERLTEFCRWNEGILDLILQIRRNSGLNPSDQKEEWTEFFRSEGIVDWILQIWRNSGPNNAGDLTEHRTESRRWCEGILDLMLQIFWRNIWMNPVDDMREYWTELCRPDGLVD